MRCFHEHLGGMGLFEIQHVAGKFNYCALQAQAYAKKGILFSRVYFDASILPSIPLSPKPGAIKIPFKSFKSSFTLSASIVSE